MQRLIALVSLLALVACGGGDGSGSAAAEGVLTGSLLAPECVGGYAITHASVEVRDEADTLIGATTTGSDLLEGEGCRVEFTVEDLPDARFYQITIGTHDAPAYSRKELEANDWHLDLSLGNVGRLQTSSAVPVPSPSPSPTPTISIDPAVADTETCVALSQMKTALSALQQSTKRWPAYQEILSEALASLDPYVYYYKAEQPHLGVFLQDTWTLANTVAQKAPLADRIEETPKALQSLDRARQVLGC